jgi:hypothetical protein
MSFAFSVALISSFSPCMFLNRMELWMQMLLGRCY